MSSSLGEKLRQAREARGISISEVAEQTRISPLYLEAIDADNYKTLPGGIFNKGFVRSYAKYVGVDEQEALQDYSHLIAAHEAKEDEKYKSYRPEVLTDDRSGSSIVPTVLFAVVILGLMTAGIFGILYLYNYLQNQQSQPVATNVNNVPANVGTNSSTVAPASQAPTMDALKVEFAAVGDAVSLTSVMDNGKSKEELLSPGNPVVFEPKQSLVLRYSKSRAQFAQLKLNGKPIVLPSQPANPKAATIEIDINQGNLAQVWQSGAISFGTDSTFPAANSAVTTNAPPVNRPIQKAAITPKPAASNANAPEPRPTAPPTMTNRPPTMTNRPPANSIRPN
jgi:cytoskeleton protein RodZ